VVKYSGVTLLQDAEQVFFMDTRFTCCVYQNIHEVRLDIITIAVVSVADILMTAESVFGYHDEWNPNLTKKLIYPESFRARKLDILNALRCPETVLPNGIISAL
jgi:hypothetical protein